MRILIDTRHLNSTPSGIGRYTIELVSALLEIDTTNEYIQFSNKQGSNKLLNLRSLITSKPTFPTNIDLIWLPNLAIANLPEDIPVVTTIHDLTWHHFKNCYSPKMRAWHRACKPFELIKRSNHIIAPSTSTKRDIQQLNPTPTTVIPHGIDPAFSPHMQARDHGVRSRHKLPRHFALFVGTLEPRKNLHALIQAIHDYRQRTRDDLHLVLAGNMGWNTKKLKQIMQKKDIQPWVHHLNYVPQEDLPALYRSASIFTFPSLYEGFGMPVLEAMASGTPVITSHTSSLPELTAGAAIHVDPYGINDLSQAIEGLLQSQSLQKHLQEAGLKQAQTFSWHQTAKQTLKVFNQYQPS